MFACSARTYWLWARARSSSDIKALISCKPSAETAFGAGLGDTALLDAHIHDIAHEVGQIKIHGGLAEHQHDGRSAKPI